MQTSINKLFNISIIYVLMICSVHAHPGRTAADQCHHCWTNCNKWQQTYGARHCHGAYVDNKQKIESHNEQFYNSIFCSAINGKTETRHTYQFSSSDSYIITDCETSNHVYEGGLDKRSSLDSVQQAVFASYVTGKIPVVVIYDTDNNIGKYEYRIQAVCELLGIEFVLTDKDRIINALN